MGSKKGVVITVAVLVAITIGSFMVWLGNPTDTEMTIVVTDFENHDAGIVERHKIISNSIEESLESCCDSDSSSKDMNLILVFFTDIGSTIFIEIPHG